MSTIAENVWLYVKGKPYAREALRKGIVNHSSLARQFMQESGEKNFEAVKAALIRASRKLEKQGGSFERGVSKVLSGSRIETKNKVFVVISKEKLNIQALAAVKGPSGHTYIVENIPDKLKNGRVIIQKGMSLITIISTPAIEQTVGVTAHTLSLLASEGINIAELFSCYTDTLLVVRDGDLMKAFEVLSSATGG